MLKINITPMNSIYAKFLLAAKLGPLDFNCTSTSGAPFDNKSRRKAVLHNHSIFIKGRSFKV